VHGPGGPIEQEMTNHLVLSVHDLPSETNPGGTWYVDVGLGDALHEPLPLMPGTYQQGPFRLALEETPGGVGSWHLTHDPAGGFSGMAWRSAHTEMVAFGERHEQMSTSRDSGFVRVLTVQRRDATGVDVLRGLTWKRIGASAHESTLVSRAELVEVLRDPLCIDVDAIDRDALDALWTRTHAAHLDWEAAGRP
jgi:arylamine N-acetyltransferase